MWSTNVLFIASIILCVKIWLTPPGYLERKQGFDFVEILEQFQSSSVCPDCEVLKTPRSRHCNLCNKCVDRFDHHCPWVNNCIGRKNFRYFYAFVVTQTLYLVMVFVCSISYISIEANYLLAQKTGTNGEIYFNELMRNNKTSRILASLLTIISLFFMSSVL